MPNKEIKRRWAIDRLMEDLALLNEKQGSTEHSSRSFPRRNHKAKTSRQRKYREESGIPNRKYRSKRTEVIAESAEFFHQLPLSEQIEFYQNKLTALRKAEKLEAFPSPPGTLVDSTGLAAAIESLKSTLAAFDRNIPQAPRHKEDSHPVRRELKQIKTTLDFLQSNISQLINIAGIANEHHLMRKPADTDPERQFPQTTTGPEKPSDVHSKHNTAALDTIKEQQWPEVKKEGPHLPAAPDFIKQETEVLQNKPTLLKVEPAPVRKNQSAAEEARQKARLEKFGELKKHLDKVTRMIEERSSIVDKTSPEQEIPLSVQQEDKCQSSEREEPDVDAPSGTPTEAAGASMTLDGNKKDTEQAVESLKLSMNPLERLTFEQYLHDLKAYDPQSRLLAVQKLGDMHHKQLTGLLLDAWRKETDNSIRAEILSALADIDYKGAVPVLFKALESSDPKAAAAALEGLYRFGGQEAGEKFVEALKHPHHSVRRRAATYLSWMEAEWAIPDLVKLLRDPDIYNRKVVVSIFSNFRSKQVVFFLIEALNDSDQGVREVIIKVLSGWTGHDLGYQPQAKEKERIKALHAWKQWWVQAEANFQFQPKVKPTQKEKLI